MLKKNLYVILTTSLLSFNVAAQHQASPNSEQEKYSYAVGVMIGQQLAQQFAQQGSDFDNATMAQGLSHVIQNKELLMDDEEIRSVLQARQQKDEAAANQSAADHLAKGNAYQKQNAAQTGVITTDSGLQYKVLQAGDGAKPTANDTVVVHYRGTLIDGVEFDSSYERGVPATFPLTGVIQGWIEVLQLMQTGAKWQVVIPPQLGYGKRGAGKDIGPNETLVFEIELLEIK